MTELTKARSSKACLVVVVSFLSSEIASYEIIDDEQLKSRISWDFTLACSVSGIMKNVLFTDQAALGILS